MDRYTDGKVTTPINVADLSQLLNRSQDDINKVEYSNLLTSVGGLCTHPNINIWAKYKPVRYAGVVKKDTFNAQGKWEKGEDSNGWWMGDGQGIMNIPKLNGESDATLIDSIASASEWTYNKPTGGETSPFRLSDFIGYKHNAECPAYPFLPLALYINKPNTCGFSLVNTDDYEFTPEEFFEELFVKSGSIQEVYLGIVVRAYDVIFRTRTNSDIIGPLPNTLNYTIEFSENGVDFDNNHFYKLTIGSTELNVIYNTLDTGLAGNNTEIEIGLFITDANRYTYYSPKFDASNTIYRKLNLTHLTTTIHVSLSVITELQIDTVQTQDLYFWHNGQILVTDEYVTGFSQGSINAKPDSSYAAKYLRLYLDQKLTLDEVEEDLFGPLNVYDSGYTYISANGNECELVSGISDVYEVYSSYEDAYYFRNSETITGYPLVIAKALSDGNNLYYYRELLIRGVSDAEDKFTTVHFDNEIEV